MGVCAAEAVDRLIRIPNDEEFLPGAVPEPYQPMLDRVNVLELIDQKIAKTPLPSRPGIAVLDQFCRTEKKIIKVIQILFRFQLFIALICLLPDSFFGWRNFLRRLLRPSGRNPSLMPRHSFKKLFFAYICPGLFHRLFCQIFQFCLSCQTELFALRLQEIQADSVECTDGHHPAR